jgi:hypothetical protein
MDAGMMQNDQDPTEHHGVFTASRVTMFVHFDRLRGPMVDCIWRPESETHTQSRIDLKFEALHRESLVVELDGSPLGLTNHALRDEANSLRVVLQKQYDIVDAQANLIKKLQQRLEQQYFADVITRTAQPTCKTFSDSLSRQRHDSDAANLPSTRESPLQDGLPPKKLYSQLFDAANMQANQSTNWPSAESKHATPPSTAIPKPHQTKTESKVRGVKASMSCWQNSHMPSVNRRATISHPNKNLRDKKTWIKKEQFRPCSPSQESKCANNAHLAK